MAVTNIGGGAQADGNGSGSQYLVDYDDVANTVGLTVSAFGTCTQMIVVVTIVASGAQGSVDCLNGQAGNILNQGREIVLGPGSVYGHPQPVNNLPVPPFGKGAIPPYVFDCFWHQ